MAEILADPAATRPPEAVVPRLAWRERVSLLAAREKDGKSTLSAAAASAVSRGAVFLEEPTVGGSVLWVGLEEHVEDAARRFQRFGAAPQRVFVVDRLAHPFQDLRAAVEQIDGGPSLIVLDSLAAFADSMVDDPGSSSAWTPVMAGLTRLARDSGAALLVIHHARKSDGRYRDSSAIGAGVDVLLEMNSVDETAIRKIRGRGRWDTPEFSLRLDGDRYALVTGELPLEERVRLFVEANPECSMRALRKAVSGRTEEIGAAVEHLLSVGALVNRGKASAMKLFTGEGPA